MKKHLELSHKQRETLTKLLRENRKVKGNTLLYVWCNVILLLDKGFLHN